MHELAIASNVVALAAEAAAGRRVRRVILEIGRLSGVVPDAVAFCFPEAARGTPVEDAALEIREIEGAARCTRCGQEFALADLLGLCPCGSTEFRRLRGEELIVKAIELRETR